MQSHNQIMHVDQSPTNIGYDHKCKKAMTVTCYIIYSLYILYDNVYITLIFFITIGPCVTAC